MLGIQVNLSKFKMVLFAVLAMALMEHVKSMKGGQILEQPLPFTVYILSGDPDDVFFMNKEVKYRLPKEVKNSVNLSEYYVQEGYNHGEWNYSHTPSHQDGGSELRNTASRDDLTSKSKHMTDTATINTNNADQRDDTVAEDHESKGSPDKPIGKTIEGNSLKANEKITPEDNAKKIHGGQPSLSAMEGAGEKQVGSRSMGCRETENNPQDEKFPSAQNSSKPPPPHCSLTSNTTNPPKVEPRVQTLWRICMGVMFNEKVILTGAICFAKSEGLHFVLPINATNHDDAQAINQVVEGRNLFDFRVVRLDKGQQLPGEIPDWQDEDAVFMSVGDFANRTGVVPSFGYPPKVAALKVLPFDECERIYDELLEAHRVQTTTLPAFLGNTVICATQADGPIKFPDGKGLVLPGLACPDSLGAPFILDDGTVLGVLVAADCKFKNVAFFQTLAKGIPTADDD